MATLADTLPSAAPAPAVKALNCPNCGGTIELRAAGYSVEVVCAYCGSRIDVSDPDARLIAAYDQAARDLEIPLGTRGRLGGVEWDAIGYLMRSEDGSHAWDEYLLFNPYHGYRWLITDGRGWSLGEMLRRTPEVSADGMRLDGVTYAPFFAHGRARVDYVLGEFYWRVERGEEVETADWVRPGYMLSWERNASEQSWTLSRLLDPEEVRRSFGVGPPRRSYPPMPHQPSPHGPTLRAWSLLAGLAIAAMIAASLLFGGGARLFEREIAVRTDAQERSVTLGPILLDRARQAVTVVADAPTLENAWLNLDYGLVNRATGVAYEASDVAERYSGRDGDGAWSEGSRRARTRFAAIPAGAYDLVIDVVGNGWNDPKAPFGADIAEPTEHRVRVVVERGGLFASNFVLAALMILVPLVIVALRHASFEKARRAESDFAPRGDDEE